MFVTTKTALPKAIHTAFLEILLKVKHLNTQSSGKIITKERYYRCLNTCSDCETMNKSMKTEAMVIKHNKSSLTGKNRSIPQNRVEALLNVYESIRSSPLSISDDFRNRIGDHLASKSVKITVYKQQLQVRTYTPHTKKATVRTDCILAVHTKIAYNFERTALNIHIAPKEQSNSSKRHPIPNDLRHT